ncbi:MAG TPA: hypothetical protein PKA37_16330, partial [Planctomycetota bacterium]|nr:hypothetical protein [Planctomycetota bacterium]
MGSSGYKSEFDQLWTTRRTRLRAKAAQEAWPTCAAAAATVAFLILVVLWWNDLSLWTALPILWASAFALAGVLAWWKGRLTGEALSVALRELDDAHQAESAFLAQAALRSKRTESRLAPL